MASRSTRAAAAAVAKTAPAAETQNTPAAAPTPDAAAPTPDAAAPTPEVHVRIDPETRFALFKNNGEFENSISLSTLQAMPNEELLKIHNANVEGDDKTIAEFASRKDAVELTTAVVLGAAANYQKGDKVKAPKAPKAPKEPKAPKDPNAPKAVRGSGKVPNGSTLSINPAGRIVGALAEYAKANMTPGTDYKLDDLCEIFQKYTQPRGSKLSQGAGWGRSIVVHLVGRGVILVKTPPPAEPVAAEPAAGSENSGEGGQAPAGADATA